MKLSTIVIAKDEEERISACLESAKWANELVVVMDDSVDNTAKIAKKYTNEVLIYKGEHDFAKLRNWAMEQTSGEWVLFLDADERILSPLKEEIVNAISGSEKSAFAIPRKIWPILAGFCHPASKKRKLYRMGWENPRAADI